jgi:hypothetical protein
MNSITQPMPFGLTARWMPMAAQAGMRYLLPISTHTMGTCTHRKPLAKL